MIGYQFTESLTTKPSIAERIAFVHHKGGTGKTTACLNFSPYSKVGKKYKKIIKEILKYFIADERRSHG